MIAALIVIRIVLQFLMQTIGVIVLRMRRPDLPRPFRMWLYPVPALVAAGSFVFILISRRDFLREVRYAGGDSGGGDRDLRGAVMAAPGVAVCGAVAGR